MLRHIHLTSCDPPKPIPRDWIKYLKLLHGVPSPEDLGRTGFFTVALITVTQFQLVSTMKPKEEAESCMDKLCSRYFFSNNSTRKVGIAIIIGTFDFEVVAYPPKLLLLRFYQL